MEHTQISCYFQGVSNSKVSSSLFRPGTTWAQQLLSQGPQSMGNSKAAQAVPMGLLSPHLTMDPLNLPIVLVSSSEVSGGKRWGEGAGETLSSRPRGSML